MGPSFGQIKVTEIKRFQQEMLKRYFRKDKESNMLNIIGLSNKDQE